MGFIGLSAAHASVHVGRALAAVATGSDVAAKSEEVDEMEICVVALVYLVMIGASLVLGYFCVHRWNFSWFPEAGAPIAVGVSLVCITPK
jgi:hypothetical protein